jgi:hypothetical protein
MAKESMKAREVKREKLVAKVRREKKGNSKRPEITALDKLPKERQPCTPSQSLLSYWTSKRIYACLRHQPYPVP